MSKRKYEIPSYEEYAIDKQIMLTGMSEGTGGGHLPEKQNQSISSSYNKAATFETLDHNPFK